VSRENPGPHVRRWRKGRRERLYVTGADGRRLGYLDVTTGLPHKVPPPRRADFDAALDEFYAARRRARRGRADVPEPRRGRERRDVPLQPLEAAPAGAPPADDEPEPTTASTTEPGPHQPLPAGPGTLVPGPSDAPLIPLEPPPAAAELAAADDEAAMLPAPRRPPGRTACAADLAGNRPGENARRKARQLTAARPIRTRLARLLHRPTAASTFRKGAASEAATARALKPLVSPWWSRLHAPRRPWYVLHSIPAGTRGADLAHLLIGPAGVYTITTTHHRGRVAVLDGTLTVSGRATPYTATALIEADRVRDRLEPHYIRDRALHVVPLIAVTGGQIAGHQVTGDGVHVLAVTDLARWLRRRGPILPPDQVEEIYEAARVSTTWTI
jgi:hypothetical protein